MSSDTMTNAERRHALYESVVKLRALSTGGEDEWDVACEAMLEQAAALRPTPHVRYARSDARYSRVSNAA